MHAARLLAITCAVFVGFGVTGSGAALANPPSVTATPISTVEGQSFSGSVGTISPCSASGPSGDVSIDWGDRSSPTEATLTFIGSTGNCSVAPLPSTPHAYAVAGRYDTEISYLYAPGAPPATGGSTAQVSDAPISLTAGKLTGTAGATISGPLADLEDSGGRLPSADYTVTIDWGDGTATSSGSINGSGEVVGSHTFAAAGSYSPQVTVVDKGGQRAQTTATIDVAAATPQCTSKPQPSQPFSPTASTPDQRWVQAVFNDLLGRQPSVGELDAFTGALGSGATREQLALTIEDSNEGADDLVSSLYREYLHRVPTANEVNAVAASLLSGGSVESLRAELLGSAEYMTDRGGGTVPGFLGALYCDTLDRSPTAGELHSQEQQLAAGETRTQVAEAVLTSSEYRADLLRTLFLEFLRRAPTNSEQQFFLGELSGGPIEQQLSSLLLGSQEYFNDFSGSGPTLSRPAVTTAGAIHVTLTQPATITMVVLMVLPTTPARDPAVSHGPHGTPKPRAPRTRTLGVVQLGHHPAGRITIRWNRRVHGHRLKRGHYLLLLRCGVGHRLTDISDAIRLKIQRPHRTAADI